MTGWSARAVRTAWPATAEALAGEQARLAGLAPAPWTPPRDGPMRVGACAVVFGRAGGDGVGWAAAVVEEASAIVAAARLTAEIDAPFAAGQLALREGPILEQVVRALRLRPDVLLVAAAGRDHPRRAGLAVQLGAVLDLPTVGVTDEPLLAGGDAPERTWGAMSPVRIGSEVVGCRVRTRGGTRPVVAHAAWRTSPHVAAEVVLGACFMARWPEAMREARRLARELRAAPGR